MRSASGCTVRTVPAATPKIDRAWCAPAPAPCDWAARRHARAASRPPKALLTSPRARTRTNADISEPRRPYIQLRVFPAPMAPKSVLSPAPIATRSARQHRASDPAPSTAFPRHPPAEEKKHQRPTKRPGHRAVRTHLVAAKLEPPRRRWKGRAWSAATLSNRAAFLEPQWLRTNAVPSLA
ncbi:hypothetical protein TvY486_0001470 [Trypanosoma vivax Y486]|uniref:Uncharacterized protein n=1 Tax=Trypanosoma vivax (strain Y486) TaxID=1055687 RepID=F9WN56_TRYVY|nr:hypothetical protein TvY486_0001470 [Trypanosoma vivax Y486]|eukprot:CCD18971.1 hypothetical protein TvY486_0001470 [Trypanosoma vivax Y486]